MSISDIRQLFPALVVDRTPEVAYELAHWLTEQGPAPSFNADWLIAAFAAAPGQALFGKPHRHSLFE